MHPIIKKFGSGQGFEKGDQKAFGTLKNVGPLIWIRLRMHYIMKLLNILIAFNVELLSYNRPLLKAKDIDALAAHLKIRPAILLTPIWE